MNKTFLIGTFLLGLTGKMALAGSYQIDPTASNVVTGGGTGGGTGGSAGGKGLASASVDASAAENEEDMKLATGWCEQTRSWVWVTANPATDMPEYMFTRNDFEFEGYLGANITSEAAYSEADVMYDLAGIDDAPYYYVSCFDTPVSIPAIHRGHTNDDGARIASQNWQVTTRAELSSYAYAVGGTDDISGTATATSGSNSVSIDGMSLVPAY